MSNNSTLMVCLALYLGLNIIVGLALDRFVRSVSNAHPKTIEMIVSAVVFTLFGMPLAIIALAACFVHKETTGKESLTLRESGTGSDLRKCQHPVQHPGR